MLRSLGWCFPIKFRDLKYQLCAIDVLLYVSGRKAHVLLALNPLFLLIGFIHDIADPSCSHKQQHGML
jgi:hypothetical protein